MKPWQTLSSRLLLDQSPWLKVYSEDVKLPEGEVVEGYLRIRTPDFAVIVPVDEDGRIGLIRSYKRGPDRIDMQPPAGMIEHGEGPLQAAKRELLEELGCKAGQWHSLGEYCLAGNLRGGLAYIFLATNCRQQQPPDSGDLEEQEIHWLSQPEVSAIWLRGEFAQLGSAAAIGLALARLEDGAA
jgi:ADP-ribose pyrophosphatase